MCTVGSTVGLCTVYLQMKMKALHTHLSCSHDTLLGWSVLMAIKARWGVVYHKAFTAMFVCLCLCMFQAFCLNVRQICTSKSHTY